MNRLSREHIVQLRRAALRYYARHRRDLPWRRTRDPYRILVSEVMLQQTQVTRVIPKYHAFLKRFPTVAALARARAAAVLRVWVGLGYNGRALRLWHAARCIVREHAGKIPREQAPLRALPGVGEYTAAALCAFAFGSAAAAVDVNVRRVLARTLLGKEHATAPAAKRVAVAAMPPKRASEWTQALMDIGATFCRAQPKCRQCPLRNMCQYRQRNGDAYGASRARGRRANNQRQSPFVGSNRFYRGRIIAALTRARSMNVLRLGRQVKDGFNLSDRQWLRSILQALAREGLIKLHPGCQRIGLP